MRRAHARTGAARVRAVEIARFGGAEVLELVERPTPVPGPGEALVKLEYAGVNFIDVYMRSGHYARSHAYETPLPMILGMEGGGVVAASGDGVTNVACGDRVAYCIVRGSYAQYAAVPAWKLVKVPDAVPLPVATALMLQGNTAHYLSHSAFALAPGHTCLVHAGAGGVGQLLIQLAKLRGAKVIATAGSRDKAEIAKSRGADHVVLYREADFREEVMRITHGEGVDVVYDAVGKDTIHQSIRSLKKRGLCVNYGGASGLVQSVEPLELAEAGSVFFTRPHLADYIGTPQELKQRADDLFDAYIAGKLAVLVDREFPLAEAAAAHRYLEGRSTRGKLLLRVPS
jgi:NADPH:quinone reductase